MLGHLSFRSRSQGRLNWHSVVIFRWVSEEKGKLCELRTDQPRGGLGGGHLFRERTTKVFKTLQKPSLILFLRFYPDLAYDHYTINERILFFSFIFSIILTLSLPHIYSKVTLYFYVLPYTSFFFIVVSA